MSATTSNIEVGWGEEWLPDNDCDVVGCGNKTAVFLAVPDMLTHRDTTVYFLCRDHARELAATIQEGLRSFEPGAVEIGEGRVERAPDEPTPLGDRGPGELFQLFRGGATFMRGKNGDGDPVIINLSDNTELRLDPDFPTYDLAVGPKRLAEGGEKG